MVTDRIVDHCRRVDGDRPDLPAHLLDWFAVTVGGAAHADSSPAILDGIREIAGPAPDPESDATATVLPSGERLTPADAARSRTARSRTASTSTTPTSPPRCIPEPRRSPPRSRPPREQTRAPIGFSPASPPATTSPARSARWSGRRRTTTAASTSRRPAAPSAPSRPRARSGGSAPTSSATRSVLPGVRRPDRCSSSRTARGTSGSIRGSRRGAVSKRRILPRPGSSAPPTRSTGSTAFCGATPTSRIQRQSTASASATRSRKRVGSRTRAVGTSTPRSTGSERSPPRSIRRRSARCRSRSRAPGSG